ncbi:KH domain-containing protein [Myxococcota bacterium]|nr:KH domain-containing protein [Myxococcota bacterium]
MRDLIDFIAKSLVDAPEQVEVTEFGDTEASIIKLKVSKEDLGKVIGKKGRTAKAMRTILSAAAMKTQKRSTLEIIE